MTFDDNGPDPALGRMVRHLSNKQAALWFADANDYLSRYPSPQTAEVVERLRADYDLMADYWLKGVKDEHFDTMYDQLVKRAAAITEHMSLENFNTADKGLLAAWRESVKRSAADWSWETIYGRLEAFVTNVAMAELGGGTREVYARHQQFRQDLFKYVVSSLVMSDAEKDDVERLLLSPTVDTIDQQLIVSALTLSAMRAFDINKWSLLADIYENSQDMEVREKALVGWALSTGSDMDTIYPEQRDIMGKMLNVPGCREELEALQVEMIYCANAEKSSQEIRDDIMPGLMESQPFRINSDGKIVETGGEDNIEDILDTGKSERLQEQMEEGMRRMAEMQKAGADIYFGGFSQMKRFPFFNDPSNWFVPYYKEHPDLVDYIGCGDDLDIVTEIMAKTPFCDSDRYSFVLVMRSVMSKIPPQMREMLTHAQAIPQAQREGGNTPSDVRRNCLQCLYRFMMLYKYNGSFINPFSRQYGEEGVELRNNGYLFLASPLFKGTLSVESSRALIKVLTDPRWQVSYRIIKCLFDNMGRDDDDYEYNMFYGRIALRLRRKIYMDKSASEAFGRALMQRPQSESARRGLARALFSEGRYEESLRVYQNMIEGAPDDLRLQLCAGACLINLHLYDEALKILYRNDYVDGDNPEVIRLMGRALMGAGRAQEAASRFGKIEKDKRVEQDERNDILCQWIEHKDMPGVVSRMAALFKHFLPKGKDAETELEGRIVFEYRFPHIIREDDKEILSHYGIGDNEVAMVAGMVYDAVYNHGESR